jgi:galactosamine-6-phosphate isomerase
MKIAYCRSYEEISRKAKDIIVDTLQARRNLLFCAATGESPTLLYKLLAEEAAVQPQLFSQMRGIKLDEWGGIPMTHAGTCESYLQQHFICPLAISPERYIAFQSNSNDPEKECENIRQALLRQGAIDICLLGIGTNGHIALNEPAAFLQPYCHVTELSAQSLQHAMIAESDEKPRYGLTLGMSEILQSREIILLINGAKKQEITRAFLSAKICTDVPASFLWLHPNVTCLINNTQ